MPHHQLPHTPAETVKATHSKVLMLLDNLPEISHESHTNLAGFKTTIYTMAAQTLETIPEETQTPPNSPTPARVTADPPKTKPATEKNPGRVASGKRLAERSRLAREAKKKAEAEAASAAAQPRGNTPAQAENTNKEESSISLMTMLGIGGLLVSAAGVYYQREAIIKSFKPSQAPAPAPQASRISVNAV